jgi:hypothetical protein
MYKRIRIKLLFILSAIAVALHLLILPPVLKLILTEGAYLCLETDEEQRYSISASADPGWNWESPESKASRTITSRKKRPMLTPVAAKPRSGRIDHSREYNQAVVKNLESIFTTAFEKKFGSDIYRMVRDYVRTRPLDPAESISHFENHFKETLVDMHLSVIEQLLFSTG